MVKNSFRKILITKIHKKNKPISCLNLIIFPKHYRLAIQREVQTLTLRILDGRGADNISFKKLQMSHWKDIVLH